MDDESGTRVWFANGEFEAQQVRAFLETHGIACRFVGESVRVTHGLTLDGLGGVEIVVAEEDAARARQLLADVEAGRLTLPDDVDIEL